MAYIKSLRYDKDQSEVVVRDSRMGKADKVDKGRSKVFALAQANVVTRTRPTVKTTDSCGCQCLVQNKLKIIEIRL